MKTFLQTLPAPPQVRELLLDSNLLLILAIGRIARERLGRDSRLKDYTAEDYELLHGYSSVFAQRVTTPHILAEVSNHLDLIDERLLPALRTVLADWGPLRESWTRAALLTTEPEYPSIGLADTAILLAARPKTIVLTADRKLWGALASRRKNAVHYADIFAS